MERRQTLQVGLAVIAFIMFEVLLRTSGHAASGLLAVATSLRGTVNSLGYYPVGLLFIVLLLIAVLASLACGVIYFIVRGWQTAIALTGELVEFWLAPERGEDAIILGHILGFRSRAEGDNVERRPRVSVPRLLADLAKAWFALLVLYLVVAVSLVLLR